MGALKVGGFEDDAMVGALNIGGFEDDAMAGVLGVGGFEDDALLGALTRHRRQLMEAKALRPGTEDWEDILMPECSEVGQAEYL